MPTYQADIFSFSCYLGIEESPYGHTNKMRGGDCAVVDDMESETPAYACCLCNVVFLFYLGYHLYFMFLWLLVTEPAHDKNPEHVVTW